MRQIILAAAIGLTALPAGAVDTSMQLVLELEGNAQRDVLTYECEGLEEPMTVEYVNAHPIFLAIVPVEGESLIFVNVISASGARYASGPYVWWTQGNEAQFIDERTSEDEDPLSCIEIENIP